MSPLVLLKWPFKSLIKCDYFWISTVSDDELWCNGVWCTAWPFYRLKFWLYCGCNHDSASVRLLHEGNMKPVNVCTVTHCECCLIKSAESEPGNADTGYGILKALLYFNAIRQNMDHKSIFAYLHFQREGYLEDFKLWFKLLSLAPPTFLCLPRHHSSVHPLYDWTHPLFYTPVLFALLPTLFSFHDVFGRRRKKSLFLRNRVKPWGNRFTSTHSKRDSYYVVSLHQTRFVELLLARIRLKHLHWRRQSDVATS